MTAFEAFPVFPTEPEPIPARYAEPVERLLEAFSAGTVTLLLHAADAVPPEWLTAARIEANLRALPLEPVQARAWPLLPQVWAISMALDGDAAEPGNMVYIHTLRRALAERLDAEWRA